MQAGPLPLILILLLFHTALQADQERIRKGEPLPEITFDSNCITPGTVFMDELGHHLRFFIRKKIAEDPLWQGPRIVFSGALLFTPRKIP